MKIFGIDPGLRNTGWGVIVLDGHNLQYRDDGIIKPDPKETDDRRLHHIDHELNALMAEHQPDLVCIEDIFVSKNPASALKLGMARGAALTAVARHNVPVAMIAARRVKQNITGSGRADKDQVSAMVSRLLGVVPKGVDSADALAIAISGMNEHHNAAPSSANDGYAGNTGLASAIEKALQKEKQS